MASREILDLHKWFDVDPTYQESIAEKMVEQEVIVKKPKEDA